MKIKKNLAIILVLAAVAAVVILVAADAAGRDEAYEREDFAMGSFVTQRLYGRDSQETAQEIIDAINRLESNGISHNYESSLICKINANSGAAPVECGEYIFDAIAQLDELARLTDGAYNPLLGPVIELWDFDSESPEIPDADELNEALSLCGLENLILDSDTQSVMLRNAGCKLHLGSAGKGMACDVAYGVLSSSGCTSAVIASGGSVLVYGEKPGGGKWSVAVRDPFDASSGSYAGVISAGAGSFVSTSGDYEKYFVENGVKYHHILDSSTGYPVFNDITSVTTVCGSGLMSDALSTACFVLGYDGSLDILEHYNAGAVFIFKDGSIKTAGNIEFTAYE